jgi:hypothetical protein
VPNVTETYVDKHGNTSTMRTAGINSDRRRDPEPLPDYPIDDDPRQLDIVNAVAEPEPTPAEIRRAFRRRSCRRRVALHRASSCYRAIARTASPAWRSAG